VIIIKLSFVYNFSYDIINKRYILKNGKNDMILT